MPIEKARQIADNEGLDLVLMSGNSNPAVCKIMDYGKYRFDSIKREKEMKKNQKIVELKEIQLTMRIDQLGYPQRRGVPWRGPPCRSWPGC